MVLLFSAVERHSIDRFTESGSRGFRAELRRYTALGEQLCGSSQNCKAVLYLHATVSVMGLLEAAALRGLGRGRAATEQKSAAGFLRDSQRHMQTSYDVFLSHSFLDAEVILGLKMVLESMDLTVYVDWADDPQLDRDSITHETADLLRTRMNSCKSLLYADSSNSKKSKWMPWELGYFDALSLGKIGILPISESVADTSFKGQEYLQLYTVFEMRENVDQMSLCVSKNLTKGNSALVEENLGVWLGKNIRYSRLYAAARRAYIPPTMRIQL